MHRSTDRILTTHVGSLVRPAKLLETILDQVTGHAKPDAAFEALLSESIRAVVRKQAAIGIDIPSDGEYSKPSFAGYIVERLSGIELRKRDAGGHYYALLHEEFPKFMAQYNAMYKTLWMPPEIPKEKIAAALGSTTWQSVVKGPISYQGQAELKRDLTNFKDALSGLDFADAFVPSVTPSRSDALEEGVYKSEEDYLFALADAMRVEYRAIVDAGFIVQLDLGLPARNQVLPGIPNPTWEDLRRVSEMQVEAYNYALKGIPPEKVRYHMCWGSMNTPHTTDIPLKDIIDIILKINAQAYALEAANPRHEHEWMVWKEVKLPEDKILIPGVISHQTNVVEHPELVAWRIRNFASVVGRENVIAGTDCGFAQGWDMIRVHEEVQWAKLQSLVQGAELASKTLW